PEDRFGVREQHALPLALRSQPLDLVAQDLDVLQRLERGDQTFLLRAVLARGREEEQFFVGIDVEVHLPARPTARPPAALRFLPGRRLRWAAGEDGLRARRRRRRGQLLDLVPDREDLVTSRRLTNRRRLVHGRVVHDRL